jgi:MFS transporter, FLVCR family, MFS-domain-containing protein 7
MTLKSGADITLVTTDTNPKVKPIIPPSSDEKATGTGTQGETLPGWTIMRPLKMRGLKKGGKNTATSVNEGSANGNGNARSSADRKEDRDLKVTETNGSGDGRGGIGQMDVLSEVRSDDELLGDEGGDGQRVPGRDNSAGTGLDGTAEENDVVVYKVYKRRWFGLVQLALLNIIVSWDVSAFPHSFENHEYIANRILQWLSFAANSSTVAQYYNTSESAVNWLSTSFLFAFVVASPLVVFTLHRGGPKPSIVAASVLLLLGNWIRYGATRSGANGNFGGVMFGQILTGLAQPFVLSAPTRYSDLWFTNRGRVAATAVMSLANPFGGALAQLIDPFWADKAKDIPNMVLYIAIIVFPPYPISHFYSR